MWNSIKEDSRPFLIFVNSNKNIQFLNVYLLVSRIDTNSKKAWYSSSCVHNRCFHNEHDL